MTTSSPNAIREQIRLNLSTVHDRIQRACDRSGRSSDRVDLIAVTKYSSIPVVRELLSLGHNTLGENRPQQLIERAEELHAAVQWHLIGQLQRNKVRAVLPHAAVIHSVDSMKLLNRIERIAVEKHLTPKILLQVNISGEEAKSGFSPEDLMQQVSDLVSFEQTQITGLMTMAPQTDDSEVIRNCFRGLRTLRDDLNQQLSSQQFVELSMGMSNDFEIAIEEGATMIRLGSTVFAGCE